MRYRIIKLIILLSSLLALFSAILYFGITIPLSFMDNRLETLASRLLDREVAIEESARLTISLHPTLEFGEISIANPRNWQGDSYFVAAKKGKGQVDLVSLLKGSIRIEELELEGVDLRLVTRADHETNFRFASAGQASDTSRSGTEFAGLDHVGLRDIRVSYSDELSGKEYVLTVDSARGRGQPGRPLMLSAEGTFSGLAYSLTLEGGPLHDLVQGGEPWPLKNGELALGDILLDASGAIGRNVEEGFGFADLALSGGNIEELGKILGFSIPDMGDFSVDARIGLRPGMVHVTQLDVSAMSSSLHGDLVFSLQGERPTLAGNIRIPSLDPRLISKLKGADSDVKNADTPQKITRGNLPWEILKRVDADLHLLVENIVVDPLRVESLRAVVSLVNGDLILPFSVTAMNTPVGGRMDVFTDEEIPEINLRIDSASTDLVPLLAAFEGAQEYSGRIGSLSLAGSTRGYNLKELADGLDLRVKLGPTKLITESGPMFVADGLTLERKPGQYFSLWAGGDFLSRPFNLKVGAGGAEESQDAPAGSLTLQLEACDTRLLFDATLPTDQSDSVAAFQFSLEGKELCGFFDSVGDFIHQATDFSVSGKGGLLPDSWFLELANIRMGNIVADGTAELKADSQGKPLIEAKIHSGSFDLRPFLPERATGAANTGDKEPEQTGTPKDDTQSSGDKTPEQQTEIFKQLLTMELLQRKRLLSADAVLHFHLDQLETGRGRVANIRFSANVKDGKLTRSPFQAEVAGKLFKGNADMDLTSEVPAINLELASNNFNLPDLFHEFKLGQSPNIAADHISLDFEFKGKNARELLRQSSQEMTIRGGRWEVQRELSEPLQIDIERAVYSSTPETPTKISLTGAINAEPLSLELTENGFLAKGTDKPFGVQLKAELADAVLSIDGKVIRDPHKDNKLRLNTTLSGERMNSLNHLFGFDLPPLGPYKISGTLDNEGNTLNFHDLMLQIGRSALEGSIIIRGTQNEKGEIEFPLHLETRLNADSIQLNDFQFGDWSPMKKESEAEAATEEGETPIAVKESGDPIDKLNDLLSPDLAAKIEGSLNIQVEEVLSGNDRLGSGQLGAKLENGRYSLDQLRLDIPGGIVHIQGSVKPEPSSIEARLTMQIDHLDYGILIRRAIPASDIKGEINLNLDVISKADNPMRLKEHLNGHLRIGVVPEDLLAGVVDLWAINILSAALPALLKGKPSKVNCFAGNFTLDDGILQPDIFMLDTTKMRVQGKGTVDFKTDAIDFHMKPTPKSAHFFSLATPVSVSGTITDPHIGVTTDNILKTVFRVVTSVVTVPFSFLFTDSMEPDGRKACSAAMDWVKEKDLNK